MTPSETPQLADRTAKQPAKPKADPNDKKLITDERAQWEKLEKMHTLLIGCNVYKRQLKQGIANQQTNPDHVQIVHAACDGAANTFRRQMLALAEYRQPRKSGDSFTAIKQANYAQQQVVQNGENGKLPKPKPSNEQGSKPAAPKALPAHDVGTGIPSGERPAGETVGAVHGPEDARR